MACNTCMCVRAAGLLVSVCVVLRIEEHVGIRAPVLPANLPVQVALSSCLRAHVYVELVTVPSHSSWTRTKSRRGLREVTCGRFEMSQKKFLLFLILVLLDSCGWNAGVHLVSRLKSGRQPSRAGSSIRHWRFGRDVLPCLQVQTGPQFSRSVFPGSPDRHLTEAIGALGRLLLARSSVPGVQKARPIYGVLETSRPR